jgi:hypothetical protein
MHCISNPEMESCSVALLFHETWIGRRSGCEINGPARFILVLPTLYAGLTRDWLGSCIRPT